jgi:hypothetical protein
LGGGGPRPPVGQMAFNSRAKQRKCRLPADRDNGSDRRPPCHGRFRESGTGADCCF